MVLDLCHGEEMGIQAGWQGFFQNVFDILDIIGSFDIIDNFDISDIGQGLKRIRYRMRKLGKEDGMQYEEKSMGM